MSDYDCIIDGFAKHACHCENWRCISMPSDTNSTYFLTDEIENYIYTAPVMFDKALYFSLLSGLTTLIIWVIVGSLYAYRPLEFTPSNKYKNMVFAMCLLFLGVNVVVMEDITENLPFVNLYDDTPGWNLIANATIDYIMLCVFLGCLKMVFGYKAGIYAVCFVHWVISILVLQISFERNSPSNPHYGENASMICSMVGSVFIMGTIILVPEMRTWQKAMVFNIAASDFLSGAWRFMHPPSDRDTALCHAQAILITITDGASILWVAAITFYINRMVLYAEAKLRKFPEEASKRVFLLSFIICWGVSFLFVLPEVTDSFETRKADFLCWIKGETKWDQFWRFFTFYFFVWLVMLYTLYIYRPARCGGHIWRAKAAAEAQNTKKLILYPVILFIAWGTGSIRRIFELVGYSDHWDPAWFRYQHHLLGNLMGFMNALVYGASAVPRLKRYLWGEVDEEDEETTMDIPTRKPSMKVLHSNRKIKALPLHLQETITELTTLGSEGTEGSDDEQYSGDFDEKHDQFAEPQFNSTMGSLYSEVFSQDDAKKPSGTVVVEYAAGGVQNASGVASGGGIDASGIEMTASEMNKDEMIVFEP